jgi:hypothetical protein
MYDSYAYYQRAYEAKNPVEAMKWMVVGTVRADFKFRFKASWQVCIGFKESFP